MTILSHELDLRICFGPAEAIVVLLKACPRLRQHPLFLPPSLHTAHLLKLSPSNPHMALSLSLSANQRKSISASGYRSP